MTRDIILKYRPDLWCKVGTCGHTVYYKTYGAYLANKKTSVQCKECRYKNHSKIMSGRKRKPFSEKWKRNLAIGHKKSDIWKASMNIPQYKEKHRQKMLRLIREGKYGRVGFNLEACNVFNVINQKLNWNGQHGKNGSEKNVDVFLLDYYEPNLNLVIEWDEKHHKKPSRHKADWIKQKIVLETLNCEFYRVDDVTKTIRKVDKISTDRTSLLQNIINEYYEHKT